MTTGKSRRRRTWSVGTRMLLGARESRTRLWKWLGLVKSLDFLPSVMGSGFKEWDDRI